MTSCCFCDEFLSGRFNHFWQLYGDEISTRVVKQTANFVVIPSIGQIVRGYLLIVPKQHSLSIANLSLDKMVELKALIDDTVQAARTLYAKPVIFEHGLARPSSGGCGIDHAHIHIAPISDDSLFTTLLHQDRPWQRLRTQAELRACIDQGLSYVSYRDHDGKMFYSREERVESQYFRKKLAQAVGQPLWDWGRFTWEETLAVAVRRYTSYFEQRRSVA